MTTTPTPPPTAPSNPAIAISKSPKTQVIASGADATFTIVVTNTGDVTLSNVFVTDALTPGLRGQQLVDRRARDDDAGRKRDLQLQRGRGHRELHERRDRHGHAAERAGL